MIPLCIFHSQNGVQHCDDGFASAWIVNEYHKGACEFFPGVYGRPPPNVEGRDVIMVDFSYPLATVREIMTRAKSMTFIDHHKSAAEIAAYLGASHPHASISFDTSVCGAVLTWRQYFADKPMPAFFDFINDRDLFLHKLDGCREFSLGLRSWPQRFINWSALIDKVPSLVRDGLPIVRYYDRQCAQMATNAFEMTIGGSAVPVANCPLIFASEVAGILCQGQPFGAAFTYDDQRRVVFSLRSEEKGVDVSEVAKLYKGGGHRHAAGFTTAPGFIPYGDDAAAVERRATSALEGGNR